MKLRQAKKIYAYLCSDWRQRYPSGRRISNKTRRAMEVRMRGQNPWCNGPAAKGQIRKSLERARDFILGMPVPTGSSNIYVTAESGELVFLGVTRSGVKFDEAAFIEGQK